MVGWPRSPQEEQWCREFIFNRTGTLLPEGTHFVCWIVAGKPVWVTAFYGWMGKTCQGAVANDRTRPFPRSYRNAVFHYVFNVLNREMFFVGVNSTNPGSEKMQRRLGFKELWRGEGLQADNGDVIFMGMLKSECPWIQRRLNALPQAKPAPRA